MRPRSLAWKLGVPVVAATLCVLVAILAFDQWLNRGLLSRRADLDTLLQARLSARRLFLFLDGQAQVTRSLVAFQGGSGSLPAPGAQEYLSSYLHSLPRGQIYDLYLAMEKRGPDGRCVIPWVTRDREHPALRYDFHQPDQGWYQVPRMNPGQICMSEPYFDRGGADIPMVSITQAILGPAGEFYGVAGTDLPLSALNDFLQGLKVEEGEVSGQSAYVISPQNRIAAGPDLSVLPGPDRPGVNLQDLPEGDLIQGPEGSARLDSRLGDRRIYWCSLNGPPGSLLDVSGWRLVFSLPDASITEPLNRFRQDAVTLALACLVLLPLGIYLSARRITRPVAQLRAAAHDAESGLYRNPELTRLAGQPGELGDLARALEHLLMEVEAREQGLKQAQETLLEQERVFRSLVENSADIQGVLDPDARVRYLNPAVTRLTQAAPEALAGRPLEELLVPADRARFRAAFNARQGPIHVHWQGADQEHALEAVFMDLTGNAAVNGVVITMRDVTASERAQAAEEQRRAAEAASQAQSAFLAVMSHELRTPLNAVVGYGEMLLEDAAEAGRDSTVADLNKILGAARHLLTLVNDILDLSRIEAGRIDVVRETFDLDALVQVVVETVRPLVARKDNQFGLELDTPLGLMTGDPTKLRQCLLNLLSNAAKFTEGGRVTLRVRSQEEWLIFCVEDQGIGMTPEELSRLFQAFSQAEAGTSRKFGGTGLGLMLTRSLCQAMGGDVEVVSQKGKGSVFTIRLPRVLPPEGEPVPPPPAPSEPSREGARVLVIDDDPAMRDMVERTLSREGYQVRSAASGEEGLALAREHPPDIVTLDVLMPRMDGWEVLRQLRADPPLAQVPVVLVSIMADERKAFSLGAQGYLSKPVDREQLVALLRAITPPGGSPWALVVDDDPQARELLRRQLEGQGWKVEEATDGLAAVEVLRERVPDLLLFDLQMPGMDGFALSHYLRSDPRLADVPAIVVTGLDLSGEQRADLGRTVLFKGAHTSEELLRLVREQVAPVRPEKGEADGRAR